MWICPVCQAPLALSGKQWQCENRHSYDRAKAGYVNLLLANQKSRPDPGDNKAMMAARRAFLEQHHYLPLVRKLAEVIALQHPAKSLTIHDAGCGEGYYLHQLCSLLQTPDSVITAAGSDISRSAIEMAAKKYQTLQFAIASNFNIPVIGNSRDVVLHIFAPASAAEVLRILVPGGLWIRVTPAPEHLAELRAALYQTPQQHSADAEIPAGFEVLLQTSLQFNLNLPDLQSRKQLLMMTPYYWSVAAGAMDTVCEKMSTLSADFIVQVFRKAPQ